MKSRYFACFILFCLLGQIIPTYAADNINSNANTPLTFENAEAWNINVETTLEIPHISSRPAFSRDSQELLYVSGQPLNDAGMVPIYDVSLIVVSLESMKVVKTIKLTQQGDYNILGKSLACSPDGKKVAYGPCGIKGGTNLLFIDLNTSKVIGVACDQNINTGVLMYWPNSTNLDVLSYGAANPNPSYRINLDTLEVSYLPEGLNQADRATFRVQTNKNYSFTRAPLTLNNSSSDLNISSRQQPYTRVLLRNLPTEWGDTLPVIWTPDLRFVLIQSGQLGFDGNIRTSLVKLGLRPTPILDFEIKQLDQTLTTEQRQIIKNAFDTGKRIWLSVYDRKINPLTGC